MQKIKITGSILASIILLCNQIAFAEPANTNLQTSAKIENTCFISAENINFGQVSSPLSTQGTSSDMRVLCTTNASYVIDLAYGGKTSSSQYRIEKEQYRPQGNGPEYNVFNSNNEFIGIIACGNPSIYKGWVAFNTQAIADLYNVPLAGIQQNWRPDKTGICNHENLTPNQPFLNIGIMTGLSKGDKLAYKVTLPGDSSKTWSKGQNSYKSTGTGEEQTIRMNANIVPNSSSSLYLAQDNYLDTIIAEISY